MATKLARAVLELSTDTASIKSGLLDVVNVAKVTEKAIADVGKMVAGAFTVTAIVAAGKQFLDFAGDVTDLSTRLGVSTDTVQKWQLAFGQAGISVEEVAKASELLSFNLVKGDKSAVAALEKLGFNLEKLKAMRAEDRFTLVADAVGRIQDKGEQLYASRTLFGKAGAELLAGLDGHLGETIAKIEEMGLVIDGETIKAADDFGDQLGLLGRQLMGIVGTVVGPLLPALSALGNVLSWLGRNVVGPILGGAIKVAMTLLGGFVEALTGVLAKLAELGSRLPGVGGKFGEWAVALQDVSKRSGAYIADLWQQKAATDGAGAAAEGASRKMLGLGGATDSASKDAKRAAEELKKWRETVNEVLLTAQGYQVVLDTLDGAIVEAIRYYREQGVEMGRLVTMYGLSRVQAEAMAEAERAEAEQLSKLASEAANAAQAFRDFHGSRRGDSLEVLDVPRTLGKIDGLLVAASNKVKKANLLGSAFADGIAELPNIIRQALTGGGGMSGAFQAFGSMIGSKIGGGLFEAGGALNGLGGKLAGIFGSSFGLALPGIGSALGALVGPALAKLWGALKRAFGGPSEQELKGRDVEARFEEEMGGFDAAVNKVGDAYERIGKTREQAAADFKAMLDAEKEGPEAVQRWIDKFREAMRQADEMREKDKASAEELKKELDAQGQARMKAAEDELQGLISQRDELAKGIAAEAPEEAMGVIEAQQRAQLAVLDEQIQSKADEYARLARETGQAMAEEIVKALQAIRIAPIDVPVNIEMPEVPHGGVTGAGGGAPATPQPDAGYADSGPGYDPSIGMARGAFGRTTGPTWFYSHGNEDFAFGGENKPGFAETIAAQVAAMAAGGGSMRPIEITVNTVMDGRTAARALHRVYNDHGELRAEGRQVLGV